MATSLEDSDLELARKLAILLQDQLLVRCVVSRSELGDRREFFQTNIVCAVPSFVVQSNNWSGFMHLGWCYGGRSNTNRGDLAFHIIAAHLGEEDAADKDVEGKFLGYTREAVTFWRGNITGDGARPHEEWLISKPFVGVASIGLRGNDREVQIEPLTQDARPFLIYYGYLLAHLEVYLNRLSVLAREFDPGLIPRCDFLAKLRDKLAAFVWQIQAAQVPRILN